jgi:DNA-binding transcriptional MerR regulator
VTHSFNDSRTAGLGGKRGVDRSRSVSEKSEGAFRTIGEVAESLDLPPHVLRFWETRFKEIEPIKRAGGRRYYRPRDMELLSAIRQLLYGQGYTIKGVQRILREQGARAVIESARPENPESGGRRPAATDRGAEEAAQTIPVVDVLPVETQHWRGEAPEKSPPLSGRQNDAKKETEASPAADICERGSGSSVDLDATRRLRRALAEIAECKRLLALTTRR